MELQALTDALALEMPEVMRWAGAIAKRLRNFDVKIDGKISGNSNTDALTLADLTLQELLVAALRDGSPLFKQCRIEAEESTGDLFRFQEEATYTLSLDPIDGTKQYRDHTGNGYAVMLHLRSRETVHYSLVYIPETGTEGTWVEAVGSKVVCGFDDHSKPAREVLDSLPNIQASSLPRSEKIYMIGYQQEQHDKANLVCDNGLQGVVADETPGSIYELMARGVFGGSLIHTPNVYDFPVSLHLARILGGDAVWVHNGQPVNFSESWIDDRADMIRLPGIVACSPHRDILDKLCHCARDWNPTRYA